MDRIRYNISQQYSVDKGVSLKMLCDKMPNEMYRRIMQSYVKSVVWRYKIIDDFRQSKFADNGADIKLLEVELKEKISTELVMEMIASMFSGQFIVVFLYNGEVALGAAREKMFAKGEKEVVATEFVPYDFSRRLSVIDYDLDCGKNTTQIFDRIIREIRTQKKEIQMREALRALKKEKKEVKNVSKAAAMKAAVNEFSAENLERIRKDAEYVQSRLAVEHINRGA